MSTTTENLYTRVVRTSAHVHEISSRPVLSAKLISRHFTIHNLPTTQGHYDLQVDSPTVRRHVYATTRKILCV